LLPPSGWVKAKKISLITSAYGQNGSMAVLAISEKGGLFAAPDFYMKKLAAPPAAKGHVDINKSATENLKVLSDCLNRSIEELVVVVMDRPRHKELIQEIRNAGARVRLISDGDVSAAISCAFSGTNIHALMGIGAAPCRLWDHPRHPDGRGTLLPWWRSYPKLGYLHPIENRSLC